MWLQAARTLERLARLGEREGVVFCLENLNIAVDHPGVPFAKAADTLALVSAVDHPNLRLNLDLYHAQIGEGNLIELLEAALPYIGEIQVADVPGRCQPGSGEINYPAIARALSRLGYSGTIAMEAFATGDSEQALADFRACSDRNRPSLAKPSPAGNRGDRPCVRSRPAARSDARSPT